MKQSTWDLINRKYERFRSYFARVTEVSDVNSGFHGFTLSADYHEFVRRYGGGMVGTYPIYGLHLAEAMGTIGHKSTAPEITKVFRDREWPGAENWLVISVDQSGNPI